VKRWFAILAGVAMPAAASACAVCGANGKSQSNFLWPTIFMSLFPLAFVFGLLLWLRSHAGEAMRGEWTERDETKAEPARPEPSADESPMPQADPHPIA
jgi:hypothetical protein